MRAAHNDIQQQNAPRPPLSSEVAKDLLLRRQRAVERLDVVAAVASDLLLNTRPEGIAAGVFARISAHLGLQVNLCYLLDERRERFQLISHVGLPEALAEELKWLDVEHSFCGAVARERQPSVAERVQVTSDPSLAHFKTLGVAAYACFPLLVNDRLIGTLSFGLLERDRIEHEELAMLQTVCNQVAVAIDRQQTAEALSDLNQALEKRVQERTAQLQESHQQMEAFTYSISHDLRAPLRAIRGFAQALAEDYGDLLDKTGQEYLLRMGEGAERLDQLIQDLLQYSRLGRSTITFDTVPLEVCLQRVLHQLDADICANRAIIKIQKPLSTIRGHEPTLEQVLVNLLSNAIKFVAPGVQPKVRIWGEDRGQTARLWIADNGIGIAQAHHQRIFGVFERLHNTEAYPGTGIGLAIVAKGVARMGGTTGLESALGEGSRFWIELPKATADGTEPP
jgi:signal transduction histidine kinase